MPGLGDFRKVWFPGPLCLGPLCHLLLLLDLVAGYQLDPAGVEKVRSLKSPTERLETCLPRTAGTAQWGNRCPVAIWQLHAGEHNHRGQAPVSKDNIASIARTEGTYTRNFSSVTSHASRYTHCTGVCCPRVNDQPRGPTWGSMLMLTVGDLRILFSSWWLIRLAHR